MTYAASYFGTVLIAMALVPFISRWAKKHHVVDAPGLRKVHRIPIPRIGGIAFIVPTLAVVLPLFFMNNDIGQSFREEQWEFIVLLLTSSLVFTVGLLDDLRSVPGTIKLLCVIFASLAVCASGATLRSFGIGTWEVQTGWAAWPLTVFWITAITVCLNLTDGLDGLAGGISAIVCGMIALLAFLTDQGAMVVLMLALLGSVTGFLFFNFYPAKIFMGDCGSMFLGFVIGAGSIVCQTKVPTLVGLAIPFLALGVPVLDTGFAVIRRRVFERRSMFAPDRRHLHHRLMDLGLHQRTVVIIIYAVTAISASVGVFMLTVEGGWSVVLLGIGLLALVFMFACLHSRQYCEMLMALKHNREIAREEHVARRCFERVELMMREAKSFQTWWTTLCRMAQDMQFMSISLWNRRSGKCVKACRWDAPEGKFPSDRTAEFSLPLLKNEASEWEIRARIWINGCLEIGGQQAMFLARIADEFPPPEHDDDEPETFTKVSPESTDQHSERGTR
jgi:UDP-GlcNAc:undecaprenyl-phosphate/decaprenyl-phosphate GlcNAc-1-phosphate transferase